MPKAHLLKTFLKFSLFFFLFISLQLVSAQDNSLRLEMMGQTQLSEQELSFDIRLQTLNGESLINPEFYLVPRLGQSGNNQLEIRSQAPSHALNPQALLLIIDVTDTMPLVEVKSQIPALINEFAQNPGSRVAVVPFAGENAAPAPLSFGDAGSALSFVNSLQLVYIDPNANTILNGVESALNLLATDAAINPDTSYTVALFTDAVTTDFEGQSAIGDVLEIVPDGSDISFYTVTLPSIGSGEYPDTSFVSLFSTYFGGITYPFRQPYEINVNHANTFLTLSIESIKALYEQRYLLNFRLDEFARLGLSGRIDADLIARSNGLETSIPVSLDYTAPVYNIQWLNLPENRRITGQVELAIDLGAPLPDGYSYQYEFTANDEVLGCSPANSPTCPWDTSVMPPGQVVVRARILRNGEEFLTSPAETLNVYRSNLNVQLPSNPIGILMLSVDTLGFPMADSLELYITFNGINLGSTPYLTQNPNTNSGRAEMSIDVDALRREFDPESTEAVLDLRVELVNRSTNALLNSWTQTGIRVDYSPSYNFSILGLPANAENSSTLLLNGIFTLRLSTGDANSLPVGQNLILGLYDAEGRFFQISAEASNNYETVFNTDSVVPGTYTLVLGIANDSPQTEDIIGYSQSVNIYRTLQNYRFINAQGDRIYGLIQVSVPTLGIPNASYVGLRMNDSVLQQMPISQEQLVTLEANIDNYFVNTNGPIAANIFLEVYAGDGITLLAKSEPIAMNLYPSLDNAVIVDGLSANDEIMGSLSIDARLEPVPEAVDSLHYLLYLQRADEEFPGRYIETMTGLEASFDINLIDRDILPGAYNLNIYVNHGETNLNIASLPFRLIDNQSLQAGGSFANSTFEGIVSLRSPNFLNAGVHSVRVSFQEGQQELQEINVLPLDDSAVILQDFDFQILFNNREVRELFGIVYVELLDANSQTLYIWEGERKILYSNTIALLPAGFGLAAAFAFPALFFSFGLRPAWQRLRIVQQKIAPPESNVTLISQNEHLLIRNDRETQFINIPDAAPLYLGGYRRKYRFYEVVPDISFKLKSISGKLGKIYQRSGELYFEPLNEEQAKKLYIGESRSEALVPLKETPWFKEFKQTKRFPLRPNVLVCFDYQGQYSIMRF